MSTPVQGPEQSHGLSPVAWVAVIGTCLVAFAAVAAKSSSLPEQGILLLWVVGLAAQIFAGVMATTRRVLMAITRGRE